MKRLFKTLATALLVLTPMLASAEQSMDFGDYEIHYNALTTDMLGAAVAEAYQIRRSPNRVMINVTVIKKTEDGLGEPVEANVTATATNLTKQFREVEMRSIKESSAVYYIGELNAANMETFDFVVTVEVDGVSKPMEVKFRQQFFTN